MPALRPTERVTGLPAKPRCTRRSSRAELPSGLVAQYPRHQLGPDVPHAVRRAPTEESDTLQRPGRTSALRCRAREVASAAGHHQVPERRAVASIVPLVSCTGSREPARAGCLTPGRRRKVLDGFPHLPEALRPHRAQETWRWSVSSEEVARVALRGLDAGRPVVYAPPVWRAVMSAVRALPRFVMRRARF